MQQSFWALITNPKNPQATLELDHNVVKVSVFAMVPLALQIGAEEADVWAALELTQDLFCLSTWAGSDAKI